MPAAPHTIVPGIIQIHKNNFTNIFSAFPSKNQIPTTAIIIQIKKENGSSMAIDTNTIGYAKKKKK